MTDGDSGRDDDEAEGAAASARVLVIGFERWREREAVRLDREAGWVVRTVDGGPL